MKVVIDYDGIMSIIPEGIIEHYALKKWIKDFKNNKCFIKISSGIYTTEDVDALIINKKGISNE